MSPLLALFWFVLIFVVGAAAYWGSHYQKIVGMMYVVAAVATVLVRPVFGFRYVNLEPAIFAVDFLLFIGLALVAIRCGRWWSIWVSALQFLAVLGHVGKLLNPKLWRLGYQLMATWSAWPAVIVLGLGVLQHASAGRQTMATTSPGFSERRIRRNPGD